MNHDMMNHKLCLVKNPQEIGEFLGVTLGYTLTPAVEYAQDLGHLEKQVCLILPSVPVDCEEHVDDVSYLLNVARSCVLGLYIVQDKTPPEGQKYCVLTHCTDILAVESALENIEAWIEWSANEYNVDLSVTVH